MNQDNFTTPRIVADYIWNLTLAFPIVMAFVPGLWPLALQGFTALGQAPEWYRLWVDAALVFAFGRKGFETALQAYSAYRQIKASTPSPSTPDGI